MSKHPVMYHLTAGYPAAPMLRLHGRTGYRPSTGWQFTSWSRAMLILCSILLIHSFTSRLQGEQNRLNFSHAETATTTKRVIAAPSPVREKFSFEYNGILQFRIAITQDPEASLPMIDISTTLNQIK